MYTGFAEVYDELMADVKYAEWADFYATMMAAYGIRSGRVCECACGTGGLTIPLAKRGFTMTGVDLSQEMLWQAAQKAREAGVAVPFVRQDMRKLHLHRPMDAILATCDGVNYLLTDEDLLDFFRAAYASLRPGGGLFFDISTPYKLRNNLGNQIICEDTEPKVRETSFTKSPRVLSIVVALISGQASMISFFVTLPSLFSMNWRTRSGLEIPFVVKCSTRSEKVLYALLIMPSV